MTSLTFAPRPLALLSSFTCDSGNSCCWYFFFSCSVARDISTSFSKNSCLLIRRSKCSSSVWTTSKQNTIIYRTTTVTVEMRYITGRTFYLSAKLQCERTNTNAANLQISKLMSGITAMTQERCQTTNYTKLWSRSWGQIEPGSTSTSPLLRCGSCMHSATD